MKHKSDKNGSKLGLLVAIFLLVYLAFFGFNISRAVDFAVAGSSEMLRSLGF